jgi:transposase InsO family protein
LGTATESLYEACLLVAKNEASFPRLSTVLSVFTWLRWFFADRSALLAENLALRQQLAVLRRGSRPRLHAWDRCFWVVLARCFANWRSWLVLVKPATVVGWHRHGFRLFWRWKSRGKPGRPKIPRDVQNLIRRIATENPLWGVPRIQAELRLLGHDLAESTVARYVPRGRRPRSQTWKTFLRNHAEAIAAVDFFTVPTVTFRNLYVFVVLRIDRRQVVHFAVSERPHAAWVARQLREAFPFDTAPKYLIRDNDGIYGAETNRTLTMLGVEEVKITPRSPWQNGYVERFIGTLRRELFDHVIVLNERHLERLLAEFLDYHHDSRCHMALGGNSPNPRAVETVGAVKATPVLGGLHHRYRRTA